MSGKIRNISDLRAKVADEGLDYFLTSWAKPDVIADDADSECLKFRQLWEEVLPLLNQLENLSKRPR